MVVCCYTHARSCSCSCSCLSLCSVHFYICLHPEQKKKTNPIHGENEEWVYIPRDSDRAKNTNTMWTWTTMCAGGYIQYIQMNIKSATQIDLAVAVAVVCQWMHIHKKPALWMYTYMYRYQPTHDECVRETGRPCALCNVTGNRTTHSWVRVCTRTHIIIIIIIIATARSFCWFFVHKAHTSNFQRKRKDTQTSRNSVSTAAYCLITCCLFSLYTLTSATNRFYM